MTTTIRASSRPRRTESCSQAQHNANHSLKVWLYGRPVARRGAIPTAHEKPWQTYVRETVAEEARTRGLPTDGTLPGIVVGYRYIGTPASVRGFTTVIREALAQAFNLAPTQIVGLRSEHQTLAEAHAIHEGVWLDIRPLEERPKSHRGTPAHLGTATNTSTDKKAPVDYEEMLLEQMTEAGLPAPKPQYAFIRPRRYRFDFAWPEHMIAVEVDGATWANGRHTRGAGYAEDCRKLNEAALLGWRVLRFTSDMVKDKDKSALRVIQRAFAAAGKNTAGGAA